jgi:hypothetical protein
VEKELWVLDERGKTKETGESYAMEQKNEEKIWHLRFGHLGGENLKKQVNKEMVKGLQPRAGFSPSGEICEGCMKGRQTREVFPDAGHIGRQHLELVHSDVCGPINPKSLGGNRYYLTFVDDFSRKSWVYLLREKSEVLKYFKKWKVMAEKHSEKKLKFVVDPFNILPEESLALIDWMSANSACKQIIGMGLAHNLYNTFMHLETALDISNDLIERYECNTPYERSLLFEALHPARQSLTTLPRSVKQRRNVLAGVCLW